MVFIRADANKSIGTGHIMRCLSIARALRKNLQEVVFVTADHESDDLIKDFDTICLDSDWSKKDEEVGSLLAMIREYGPSLLLVDSYTVTEQYFNMLKDAVKIAYIDDLNANKWNVDFLINYNIYGPYTDYTDYENSATKMLLGTEYAPLRDEFTDALPRTNFETVGDVLVSAGGSDPEAITEKMIDTICKSWQDIRFHFVVGAMNPRIDSIRQLERENVILHIREKHMSELMKKCDIAVSAAGSTLYELCALGVPTVTYTLADNQIEAAQRFGAMGIMINAGDCRDNADFILHLDMILKDLISDEDKRRNMSKKMQTFVDGRGAYRIVEYLCASI